MAAILSIDEQIASMKAAWPQFAARGVDRRAQSARWVGSVRPQYASYSLEIRYELGSFPEVRVLSPVLIRYPGTWRGSYLMSIRRPRIPRSVCSILATMNGQRQ